MIALFCGTCVSPARVVSRVECALQWCSSRSATLQLQPDHRARLVCGMYMLLVLQRKEMWLQPDRRAHLYAGLACS